MPCLHEICCVNKETVTADEIDGEVRGLSEESGAKHPVEFRCCLSNTNHHSHLHSVDQTNRTEVNEDCLHYESARLSTRATMAST